MTLREKAICEVFTGICFCAGEKRQAVYEYASELLGRPVYTHEFYTLAGELKEKARADFIAICNDTYKEAEQGYWEWYQEVHRYGVDGAEEEFGYRCSTCKMYASEWGADDDIYEEPPTHLHYCPNCGTKMTNEEEPTNEQP